MFKSNRKRQRDNKRFEQQLNEKLNLIKEQSPNKQKNGSKYRQMANILDEAVNELMTPTHTDHKIYSNHTQHHPPQIHQRDSIRIDQNSSISLNSRLGMQNAQNLVKQQNHISYLVSVPQVVKILQECFIGTGQHEKIRLSELIKKIYPYYYGIGIKEEQLSYLKNKLRVELTTTDADYISLNAFQIIAKKHNLSHYFQSAYLAVKVEMIADEYEKKNKQAMQQISDKQHYLKQRQARLDVEEQDYQKRYSLLMNKQKTIIGRQKQLNLRQKQLKKNIQEKIQKLYDFNLQQFNQKIKQAERRLSTVEKNIKYKIEILQRRAQSLKILINQKNDLKNKKIMGENEARIRLRKMQRQMENLQKKYQSQIQLLQKQQKQMVKSISIVEDKLNKSDKKLSKYKQKCTNLEQQISKSHEQLLRITAQNQQLQRKIEKIEDQYLNKPEQTQVKIKSTNRSNKSKKKTAPQQSQLIKIYQNVIECLYCESLITHSEYQQKIQIVMKATMQQLPQLIFLLTAQEQNQSENEPHYLIINIIKIIVNEFYHLNSITHDHQSNHHNRLKSAEIEEILKYPYRKQVRFSLFLLLLQVYDWSGESSSRFFKKTIEVLIDESQSSMAIDKSIKNIQILFISSPECIYYMITNNFSSYIIILSNLQNKPEPISSIAITSIALLDLSIHLIKAQENCVFDKLSSLIIEKDIIRMMLSTLDIIMSFYTISQKERKKNQRYAIILSNIQALEELAEKSSILIQRFYYKYDNLRQKMPQIKKFRNISQKFLEVNKLNGNGHTLISANLKSISQMIKECQ